MHPHEMSGEPGTCAICGMDLIEKAGDPAEVTQPGAVLVVPAAAVLSGGTRKLVYVESQEPGPEEDGEEQWPGLYEPREIRTGFRIGDEVIVLSGLAAGERVVTRGQFLIDSQLQLTGRPSLFAPAGAGAAPADPHAGH
jgi:Cu(I)/Ag(I) efflux system membrane fusion protein